jgi:L-seryl-tRNA(Ser) seleniumtransferase
MLRALRVDKLTYAALEATLAEHLAGRAEASVPVLRMAALGVDAIDARAGRLARALGARGWRTEIVDGFSTIGGGSAPGAALPTRLLVLAREGLGADVLDARLRALQPPIVGRIEHDRLLMDLRTVREEEDDEIVAALSGW